MRSGALLLSCFLLSCGGSTGLDAGEQAPAARSDGPAAGAGAGAIPSSVPAAPSVPSFSDEVPTRLVAPPCTRCEADDECGGPDHACVALGSAGFCAPGCSKDGFCTPDRVCTWVNDPAGRPWRACLPRVSACSVISVQVPDHAGAR
jgi:hypothetical protein